MLARVAENPHGGEQAVVGRKLLATLCLLAAAESASGGKPAEAAAAGSGR